MCTKRFVSLQSALNFTFFLKKKWKRAIGTIKKILWKIFFTHAAHKKRVLLQSK